MNKPFNRMIAVLISIAAISCSKESISEPVSLDDTSSLESFSVILSKAVYESKDVRTFIKEKALEMNDNDYDVFYPVVKNEKMHNGQTFREALLDYCDEPRLTKIEAELPLLTIYIPDMRWLGKDEFSIDSWDPSCNEVAVTYKDNGLCTKVFAEGKLVDSLEPGVFPGCATLIVKGNERIVASATTKGATPTYNFKGDAYDGRLKTKYVYPFDPLVSYYNYTSELEDNTDFILTSDFPAASNMAIEAYNEFMNKPEAAQRDYCYYGMTVQNPSGQFNTRVEDRIFRFKIDPSAYASICDESDDGSLVVPETDDQQGRHDYSKSEILSHIWADGNLEIVITVFWGNLSGEASNVNYRFNVKPSDIFQIRKIKKEFWHSTWVKWYQNWRYSVSTSDLVAKWYYPAQNVYLPTWNLKQSSSSIVLKFMEEDSGNTKEETYSNSFNSLDRADIGLVFNSDNCKINFGLSSELECSYSFSSKITSTNESDSLGDLTFSYTNPYISSVTSTGYNLYSRSSGLVTLCLLPTQN
jgi:hypothetical protein